MVPESLLFLFLEAETAVSSWAGRDPKLGDRSEKDRPAPIAHLEEKPWDALRDTGRHKTTEGEAPRGGIGTIASNTGGRARHTEPPTLCLWIHREQETRLENTADLGPSLEQTGHSGNLSYSYNLRMV